MITFNLNGRKVEVDCEPMDRLSDVLRNKLGLKGTKAVSYTHLTLPTILLV